MFDDRSRDPRYAPEPPPDIAAGLERDDAPPVRHMPPGNAGADPMWANGGEIRPTARPPIVEMVARDPAVDVVLKLLAAAPPVADREWCDAIRAAVESARLAHNAAERAAEPARILARVRDELEGAAVNAVLRDARLAAVEVSLERWRALTGLDPDLVLGARPLDVSDIFAPLPATPWLSRDLQWAPGRPCQIQGAGGAGKSFAIYAAALALAAGRPVWGKFRPSRQNVRTIVLDYDGGGAQRRIQRLAPGMGIDPAELAGKLRIVRRPPVRLSSFKMDDAAMRATAVDTFAAVVDGWDLCVVDALRGIAAGVDENDSRIRDFLDVLGDASDRTGCTFVFLHHSGKGAGDKAKGERGRGSSAIQDGSGSVLSMAEAAGQASTFSVEITRDHEARDAPRIEPFYLRIVDVPIERLDVPGLTVECRTAEQVEGAPIDKIDTKRRDLYRKILAFVASSPGADVAAIKGSVGAGNTTVSNAIGALLSEGFTALVDRGPTPGAKRNARSLYLADGVDAATWEPPAVTARKASVGTEPCPRCDPPGSGEWRNGRGRAGPCAQCGGEGQVTPGQRWALPREHLVTYPDRRAGDDA
jgi:hypothetical protein